jgi:hypothetical protein
MAVFLWQETEVNAPLGHGYPQEKAGFAVDRVYLLD